MIKIEKDKQIVIRFFGSLNATNSDSVKETIINQIEPVDRDIIMDVSELNYISSAGLQVILYCAKKAKAASKESFLHGAKDGVLEVFKLSGFLTFLKEI